MDTVLLFFLVDCLLLLVRPFDIGTFLLGGFGAGALLVSDFGAGFCAVLHWALLVSDFGTGFCAVLHWALLVSDDLLFFLASRSSSMVSLGRSFFFSSALIRASC